MSRMLPSRISPEVTSTAEKRVFEWLKSDPRTEDWIVIHSLGMAHHETLMFGEIDFVVLAPQKGIFCLEVKGGGVSRKDGYWEFTNKYGATNKKARGPFDQAREGMFSLMKEIKANFATRRDFSSLLFGYGAVFPDITFNVESPEFDSAQIWDRDDCGGFAISTFIDILSHYTQNNQEKIFGDGNTRVVPSAMQVKEIANLLRGDFDRPISLFAHIDEAVRVSARLTDEQFRCLDMFEDNKRLLVEGGAGTGKTILALELARRATENHERFALFCYNKRLGDWLVAQMSGKLSEGSFVGTFHSFMMGFYDGTPADDSFFENVLPEKVLSVEPLPRFDRVIIDEAQDFVSDAYLAVVDRILLNGIDRGRWNMFGDFGMQAIYQWGKTRYQLLSGIEEVSTFARARLTINCRNTKSIGAQTKIMTGFESKFLASSPDGLPVTYLHYEDEAAQEQELQELLQELKKSKVPFVDIVILSPFAYDKSVASRVASQVEISPKRKNGTVFFSTIAAFKGLESPVVIIADCESYANKGIVYVGLTRAKAKLYLLESTLAQSQRASLIKEQLNG